MKKLILATRGSLLALKQANIVKELLEQRGVEAEILETTTKGDKDRIHALVRMGGNGVFIREIEERLLTHEADIAVHSGKDLPYELARGLVIACTPPAADPRDCLILRKGHSLTKDSVIGTGSPRRMSEYRAIYGDAIFKHIRGNVTTRLRKLRDGEYDGIILARAGLDRIGADLSDLEQRIFDPEEFMPSPCQGIIAVECREDDKEVRELLSGISDRETWQRFSAERALFCSLKADCTSPIGVHSKVEGTRLSLSAMLDGRRAYASGDMEELDRICGDIRKQLLLGSVTLVGGGCGPGLLTEKGARAIEEADAIVYDDLLGEGFMSHVSRGAELIYVGKRAGRHSMSQEEINALLIRLASEGKRVIRLKGGDSFVFGRGGEEVLALSDAGIPYEVIPGISSAIAVPEHLGIPVTHRGMARSFTVITGHTRDDTEENWDALAGLSGTLVFLMGLSRLEHIASELMDHGKSPDTPVSILSEGFSPTERRIDGTLSTIVETADREKPATPAIIVVGEVAALHMEGTLEQPALLGVRVMVTGSERFTETFSRELRRRGGSAVIRNTISIRPMPENIPDRPEDYDWIVFTSRNGIEVFFQWLGSRRADIRSLSRSRFACVGSSTGDELAAHGIYADFVPSEFTAERLGSELPGHVAPGERVLILRAQEGSRDLDLGLSNAGVDFEARSIYRTEEAGQGEATGIYPGSEPDCDYIVFASGSGVRSFFNGYEEHGAELAAKALGRMVPVCIGQATASELEKRGIGGYLSASEHTAAGILSVIEDDIRKRKVKG